MSKRVGCIVQARMGSRRLPGKVLKKVNGKPVLWYVVERLKQCKSLDEIVVATSTNEADDEIEDFCRIQNVRCFRGSEENVLERYFYCASFYGFDVVVRATADNPLVSPMVVDRVVNLFLQEDCDYVSNTVYRSFPRGLDIEVFSFDALKLAFENAVKPEEKEHCTIYMYDNPDKFKLMHFSDKLLNRPELKLAIDTENDFAVLKAVFLHFDNPLVKVEEVIKFIDECPELKKICMKEEKIYRNKTKNLNHKFLEKKEA